MKFAFTIPGSPVPWQRAGVKGKRHFTRPETRIYQDRIRQYALIAGVKPLKRPVTMTLSIFVPDNHVRDDDNIEKSIRDALQANARRNRVAIAFKNDHYITEVHKFVEIDPKNPRVEVELCGELDEKASNVVSIKKKTSRKKVFLGPAVRR